MIEINMQMPEKCGLCPCFHHDNPMYCQAVKADKNKRIVNPYGSPRPEWCPLKEQEPKIGHWVDRMCRDFQCSECKDKLHNWIHADGYCYDDLPKFCPNCGAKMERGIMDRDGNIAYPDNRKRR